MRPTKKTPRKPPPDVVYVVVDRSDVFSHSVHTTKEKAKSEAAQATEMWLVYGDRGPFTVVEYARVKRSR
jgi:environmental stress-induced protein Ves